jgi:hypothetical protein
MEGDTWHNNEDDELLPITQSIHNTSVEMLHRQLEAYKGVHPEATFVLVGHSLGGVVAMEEVLQNVDNSTDYQPGFISTLITIDSPLLGVPREFANLLTNFAFLQCATTEGDAFNELVAIESRKEQHRNYLGRAIDRVQDKGVSTITAGNNFDCVLAPQICIRDSPVRGDIETQFIPSALVEEFNIRPPCVETEEVELYSEGGVEIDTFSIQVNNCILATHNTVLHDQNARERIAELIGRQYNR